MDHQKKDNPTLAFLNVDTTIIVSLLILPAFSTATITSYALLSLTLDSGLKHQLYQT